MRHINKISSHFTVDFAAEELKKYLRMMMPEGGNVGISYSPEATDGYRLGLMSDFGLDTSDVQNAELDDVVYIDCDVGGGIIAGSNPRSVLLAVYEYLRKNGCRWLLPGVDGEYIPMKGVEAVKYRHKASMRFRGNCIEGAASQQILNDYVDFMPKVGLNTFMLQFRVPEIFYERFYNRSNVEDVSTAEPIDMDAMLQWTRLTECEMEKRGIMLHSYGHGFTVDPLCYEPAHSGWVTADISSLVPKEKRDFIAMINGKREFFRGMPMATNLCMSNPAARAEAAKYIAEYAKSHPNVDFLHVWLGDSVNSHCECDECKKMIPSDWYVTLLNEVDEKLTKMKLNTRIVFIAYHDTYWAPEYTKIKNPDRFTLMLAPITRDYSISVGEEKPQRLPYVRNNISGSKNLAESFAYFDKWKKTWHGPNVCFEYHFWIPFNCDVSGIKIAERVYEDIKVYAEHGFDGIIECGTQRSFFPHGLAFYTHAMAQYDASLSFGDISEDYFAHTFGDAAEEFKARLLSLEKVFPSKHFGRVREKKNFYSPELAEGLKAIPEIAASLKELIKKNFTSGSRVKITSLKIMEFYTDYLLWVGRIAAEKAVGNDREASRLFDEFLPSFAAFEPYLMNYVDMHQTVRIVKQLKDCKSNKDGDGETEKITVIA